MAVLRAGAAAAGSVANPVAAAMTVAAATAAAAGRAGRAAPALLMCMDCFIGAKPLWGTARSLGGNAEVGRENSTLVKTLS